jgi:hypothetical protein
VPSLLEYLEVQRRQGPRLWVDLLQRATGKLRWTPFSFARVNIVVTDAFLWGDDRCIKAVLDSLKVSTHGRADGRTLHYFGTIVDDDSNHVVVEIHEQRTETPADGHTRVIVRGSVRAASSSG